MDDETTFEAEAGLEDKIGLLQRIPMFAGLGSEPLSRIAEVAERVDVPAGEVLTHEGRYEGYFYLIVEGNVEIRRGGAVVDVSRDGSFVGEIALLDAGPRTATATTLTPCLLLKVNNQAFDETLGANPAVAEALESEMARRLERIDSEAGSSPTS